jgi:hypothetical protein
MVELGRLLQRPQLPSCKVIVRVLISALNFPCMRSAAPFGRPGRQNITVNDPHYKLLGPVLLATLSAARAKARFPCCNGDSARIRLAGAHLLLLNGPGSSTSAP